MKPYKPDVIITNCPGCNMFMDRWQYTIKEMEGKTYGENGQSIPVPRRGAPSFSMRRMRTMSMPLLNG